MNNSVHTSVPGPGRGGIGPSYAHHLQTFGRFITFGCSTHSVLHQDNSVRSLILKIYRYQGRDCISHRPQIYYLCGGGIGPSSAHHWSDYYIWRLHALGAGRNNFDPIADPDEIAFSSTRLNLVCPHFMAAARPSERAGWDRDRRRANSLGHQRPLPHAHIHNMT